ncbi:MAG: Periplasmic serine protease (ClpP class) SppA [Candidatus Methanohalarchaeum thermophilum]|uniref:Periplasmic serine protease (ClpP class) SppA n=1 Tax=Methanohalarchaeum thermophilum TaxID=1903181 RepID=A0A1Q6DTZ6_METT1|nr:MAG: Periplasmic serine protease (ClpP class) SppA [Candidatus Methanohalarchaeum thermophilum]
MFFSNQFIVMFENLGSFDYITILILVVIGYVVMAPRLQIWRRKRSRLKKISEIESETGNKVITMIHRKTPISLFGVPVFSKIDVEDSEEIIRSIRENRDEPIDLVIHTPGGSLLPSIQIAKALKSHNKKTRVIVPHFAMSGGTIIALGADEIVMDKQATIGPVDPQIGDLLRGVLPAKSWISVKDKKELDAEDSTLALGLVSEWAMNNVDDLIRELIEDRVEDVDKVCEKLLYSNDIHSYPIFPEKAEEIGLNVSTDLPKEIHSLMELYKSLTERSNVENLVR